MSTYQSPPLDPALMRRLADNLSAGLTTGHDWSISQDELTRLQGAKLLRDAADELEVSRAAPAPAGEPLREQTLLEAASHALRSYQYGNGALYLAKNMADKIDAALAAPAGEPPAPTAKPALRLAAERLLDEVRLFVESSQFADDIALVAQFTLSTANAAPAGEHETPLQVIEAMQRDERAPSYEELRERHREKRL